MKDEDAKRVGELAQQILDVIDKEDSAVALSAITLAGAMALRVHGRKPEEMALGIKLAFDRVQLVRPVGDA